MTKLLVASGNHNFTLTPNVEIINLDEENPNLICDDMPDLPSGAFTATGQLFMEKIPIICGGFGNECKCQAFLNGSWNSTPNLNECRLYAKSAITTHSEGKEVLIFAGGYYNNTYFDSVESFDGTSWDSQQIANLPKPLEEHCIVKVNSSTLLSIGGFGGLGWVNNTYFYSALENKWTPGPSLYTTISSMSCAILRWKNTESNHLEKIVVTQSGTYVSLLNLNEDKSNNEQQWVIGPELSFKNYLNAAEMIEYNNSVILVGGEYDGEKINDLYQLSSPDGPWVKMRQTLKRERSNLVSFLVPDELVNCYE
jgi:hypothetical protein